MPLQLDATTRYATGNYTQAADRGAAELEVAVQHPYPQGAAADSDQQPRPVGDCRPPRIPANTNDLYFVVKPCGNGEQVFTSNYNQFLADAQQYQSARTGRREVARALQVAGRARKSRGPSLDPPWRRWLAGRAQPSPAMQNAALERSARRLALPADCRFLRSCSRRPSGRSGGGLSRRQRDDPAQTRGVGDRHRPTPRACAIGAANTLIFEAAARFAPTTPTRQAWSRRCRSPRRKTALVLGAGGSARAAVWALLDAGAREVRVGTARATARAQCPPSSAAPRPSGADPADLLVNCTAVGLDPAQDGFKPLPLDADDVTSYECVVDLGYSATETPLVQAARARSVRIVDGRERLVRQGALSFEMFTGHAAPIEVMRRAAGAR